MCLETPELAGTSTGCGMEGRGKEERANVCIKISHCNERQKEARVVRASMCCERASVAGRGPGSIRGARVWALEGGSLPFPPMDH